VLKAWGMLLIELLTQSYETDDDNDTDCENESVDSMVLDKDEQGDDNVEY